MKGANRLLTIEEKMADKESCSRKAGSKDERPLAVLSMRLVQSNLRWAGRGLLKVLRLAWHKRTIEPEHLTTAGTPEPTGPFRATRKGQQGDLLIWVPRR